MSIANKVLFVFHFSLFVMVFLFKKKNKLKKIWKVKKLVQEIVLPEEIATTPTWKTWTIFLLLRRETIKAKKNKYAIDSTFRLVINLLYEVSQQACFWKEKYFCSSRMFVVLNKRRQRTKILWCIFCHLKINITNEWKANVNVSFYR